MFDHSNEATSLFRIPLSIHSAFPLVQESGPRLRDWGRSREGRPLEAGRVSLLSG
jgi:hypothetical protein